MTQQLSKKRLLAGFCLGAIAASIFAVASDAQAAFWTRQDASACTSPQPLDYNNGQNTGSGSIWAYCPVNDTSATPKESATYLNFYLDTPSAWYVSRCAHFWNATGWNCGSAYFGASGNAQGVAVPAYSGWTNHFGELQVLLPAGALIKGFTTGS